MTPASPSAPPGSARRRPARLLGVVLLAAVVLTAGAPTLIRVRSGDTLWQLARTHHTSVSVLRRLNHFAPGTVLQAGSLLALPGDRSGPSWAESTNAGVTISERVRRSVARHRALLARRHLPGHAAIRRLIIRIARQHGLDPALALAVAWNESGFQQRVVSPVDAIGVMQVLPSTARVLSQQLGRRLDLLAPSDNVLAGVILLRQLVRATHRVDRALAGYYQGLGSIDAIGLLPQTRDYIRTVSALRAYFARSVGGRA